MWIIAMFDLPTETKVQRHNAQQFRKLLMQDGFHMLQFSVYARPCPSPENAAVHDTRVTAWIPEEGQVRLLIVTDQQFARMKVFHGKSSTPTEKPPAQITFF